MCSSLFRIRDVENRKPVDVPCGKCAECRSRRISEWSFRLMQEERYSDSAWFVTFTFSPAYVSFSLDKPERLITSRGYLSLNKRIFQLFLKRLRKKSKNNAKITYFAVGEYGSDNFRPHYHALLFNSIPSDVVSCWTYTKGGVTYPIGDVYFGSVSGASVGYTLKYISKQSKIPLHRNDDREPEFSLMSKGLGKGYLSSQMVRYHLHSSAENSFCTTLDGVRIGIPRYYKKKIIDVNPEFKEKFSSLGLLKARKKRDDYVKIMLKRYGNNWRHFEMQIAEHKLRLQNKSLIKKQKL